MKVRLLSGYPAGCATTWAILNILNFFKMHNQKKTTTALGAKETTERIYTEPGVYGLIEEPINGLKKAVLVYHEDDEHYVEMFKHFETFITTANILKIHIDFVTLLHRIIFLAEKNIKDFDFFESIDQKNSLTEFLDFLSKISSEEAWALKERVIAKRIAKEIN